jgi:hypothetical protein
MENRKSSLGHHYDVKCYDSNGNIKWRESFKNLVPLQGRNHYLDATLKTGFLNPQLFIGLKNAGTIADTDTPASHPGWNYVTEYSVPGNPFPASNIFVPGTISNGSVTASTVTFNMDATATVGGAWLIYNDNSKDPIDGIFLGIGNFPSAHSVFSGDIIQLTITCSITST